MWRGSRPEIIPARSASLSIISPECIRWLRTRLTRNCCLSSYSCSGVWVSPVFVQLVVIHFFMREGVGFVVPGLSGAPKPSPGRALPLYSFLKIYRTSDARPISLLPAVATAIASATVSTIAAEARLSRLGLVHLDVPALELRIVELRDSLGRLV